jgi:hypothetical protein
MVSIVRCIPEGSNLHSSDLEAALLQKVESRHISVPVEDLADLAVLVSSQSHSKPQTIVH